MAKLAVHRPFDEGDLDDDLRTHPMRAHAWQPDGLRERRLRDLERIQPRAEIQQQLRVETGADLPAKTKSSRLEVAHQQRAEADPYALWVREPANDELLRRFTLHLQPVRRAAMLVL